VQGPTRDHHNATSADLLSQPGHQRDGERVAAAASLIADEKTTISPLRAERGMATISPKAANVIFRVFEPMNIDAGCGSGGLGRDRSCEHEVAKLMDC
jgi:hypothetical protein